MTSRRLGAWVVVSSISMLGCHGEADGVALRPEGPPEVVAVLAEPVPAPEPPTAIPLYCRYLEGALDELAPRVVDGAPVCPPTEAQLDTDRGAPPLGFGIRVMFDELLGGDFVETLDCDLDGDGVADDPLICQGHVDATPPATITCVGSGGGVADLPFTTYYVPNGNRVIHPLGPSIYLLPPSTAFTLPTGSECELRLEDVLVDEDGEPIPGDQTSYPFRVAELGVVGSVPADGGRIEPTDVLDVLFNANLDPAEVDITDVEVLGGDGAPISDYDMAIVPGLSRADVIRLYSILPDGFAPGQYTARVKAGVTLGEVNGGTTVLDAPYEVRFTVD